MRASHLVWVTIVLGAAPQWGHGQVTIGSGDMFNEVGQYYKVYANNGFPDVREGTVNVSGRLGEASAEAQLWNFTTGPTDRAFRFDYVAPEEVDLFDVGSVFPEAELAEKMTDITAEHGDATDAPEIPSQWQFVTQEPGFGRINYGFYAQLDALSEITSTLGITIESSPRSFNPPISPAFPTPMNFRDSWAYSTQYSLELSSEGSNEENGSSFGPTRIVVVRNVESEVDAFGTINLPQIGFADCLRVNELVEMEIQTDLTGEGLQTISRQFVRNYYWIADSLGIAAQITSRARQDTPPPESFSSAAFFTRMFETNHPEDDDTQSGPVLSVEITKGNDGVLLNWNTLPNVSEYRIEYTSDLSAGPDSWQVLTTTGSDFTIDSSSRQDTMRLYRVIPLDSSEEATQ